MKTVKWIPGLLVILILVGWYFYSRNPTNPQRILLFRRFIRDPEAYPDWQMRAGERCGDAPFVFPTQGFVGFLWGDSFRPGHAHQGIDIFGGKPAGQTAVYAAYDGYLSRLTDWKSSLIIRIPKDPLNPSRQIWNYYTHIADKKGNSYIAPEFPPGSIEIPIKAGTFLGYQGDYSGDPDNPTGVHLHFSIVLDDGKGHFLNELELKNTLDPSAYFQINLNAKNNPDEVPLCTSTVRKLD
jgi:peptidoglycan LD-endopeptidase LytH